jgi:hypothetical protein
MAGDAGRDPRSLPISLFRVPADLYLLRSYRDAGVARVVITVPAEKRDGILPILDQWAPLVQAIG